jgi:hypothetical protein
MVLGMETNHSNNGDKMTYAEFASLAASAPHADCLLSDATRAEIEARVADPAAPECKRQYIKALGLDTARRRFEALRAAYRAA